MHRAYASHSPTGRVSLDATSRHWDAPTGSGRRGRRLCASHAPCTVYQLDVGPRREKRTVAERPLGIDNVACAFLAGSVQAFDPVRDVFFCDRSMLTSISEISLRVRVPKTIELGGATSLFSVIFFWRAFGTTPRNTGRQATRTAGGAKAARQVRNPKVPTHQDQNRQVFGAGLELALHIFKGPLLRHVEHHQNAMRALVHVDERRVEAVLRAGRVNLALAGQTCCV